MDKLALYFYYLSVFKELKIVDVIKERLKLCVQERGLCCLKSDTRIRKLAGEHCFYSYRSQQQEEKYRPGIQNKEICFLEYRYRKPACCAYVFKVLLQRLSWHGKKNLLNFLLFPVNRLENIW